MDKMVRRVTVVQGSGANRQVNVVYESPEAEKDESPSESVERVVRRLLKADLVRAQEAYDRHLKSVSKGKDDWWIDAPANIAKAIIKAERKARSEAKREHEDAGD